MPATSRKSPNPKDFTGKVKAQLMADHAAQLAERQAELGMFNAQQQITHDTPIQLDEQGRELGIAQDVPDGPVALEKEYVQIKVACDLEHVTIGQGSEYNFKDGQTYMVERKVADHLQRLGYVLVRY